MAAVMNRSFIAIREFATVAFFAILGPLAIAFTFGALAGMQGLVGTPSPLSSTDLLWAYQDLGALAVEVEVVFVAAVHVLAWKHIQVISRKVTALIGAGSAAVVAAGVPFLQNLIAHDPSVVFLHAAYLTSCAVHRQPSARACRRYCTHKRHTL